MLVFSYGFLSLKLTLLFRTIVLTGGYFFQFFTMQFGKISALLYFPSDSTFAICSIEDISTWSYDVYISLVEKPLSKTRVEAEFDGRPYSAIIVQCASTSLDLETALDYAVRAKNEKNINIERLLQLLPSRFSNQKKRPMFPTIKVSI